MNSKLLKFTIFIINYYFILDIPSTNCFNEIRKRAITLFLSIIPFTSSWSDFSNFPDPFELTELLLLWFDWIETRQKKNGGKKNISKYKQCKTSMTSITYKNVKQLTDVKQQKTYYFVNEETQLSNWTCGKNIQLQLFDNERVTNN